MSGVYDICIVGAGAVGLYLASALSETGKSIALLECSAAEGGRRAELVGPDFYASDHSGVRDGWTTGMGGTTQLWGGQLWPWRPWEFSWEHQGQIDAWPVAYSDLAPHYAKVLARLGLGAAHEEIHAGLSILLAKSTKIDDQFSTQYSSWLGWRQRNFAANRSLAKGLKATHLIKGALVESVSNTGSHKSIRYKSIDCGVEELRANVVILAAGTVGNVRILQHSALADSIPLVGTGFMDHVSARVAEFEVSDWPKFRDFASHKYHRGVLAAPRMVADPTYLKRKGILPSYGHWEFSLPESSPVRLIRRGLRDVQGGKRLSVSGLTKSLMGGFGSIIEASAYALPRHQRPILRGSRVYLRVDVQQPRNLESRLEWNVSEAGGDVRSLQVQWQVGDAEYDAMQSLGGDLAERLEKLDIGLRLLSKILPLDPQDTFHMMGGTSIGTDTGNGVVDSDLQLLGVAGMFVAGSSVFPTGGMANPTFTSLALADRLVDHLLR